MSVTTTPTFSAWGPPPPAPTNNLAPWAWIVTVLYLPLLIVCAAVDLPLAALALLVLFTLTGLTFGIIGAVRAHRRARVGMAHSVVGIVLNSVLVALLASAAGLGALSVVAEYADRYADGYGYSVGAPAPMPNVTPHPLDDVDVAPDAGAYAEQRFFGALYESTYMAYSDEDLLIYGYAACTLHLTGMYDDDEVEYWLEDDMDLTSDEAFDINYEAVNHLCP